MKQIHNDAQRDTWGQKEEKAKTRRQEFLFLLLLSLQVFLGLFPYLFPSFSEDEVTLLCSVLITLSFLLILCPLSFSKTSLTFIFILSLFGSSGSEKAHTKGKSLLVHIRSKFWRFPGG